MWLRTCTKELQSFEFVSMPALQGETTLKRHLKSAHHLGARYRRQCTLTKEAVGEDAGTNLTGPFPGGVERMLIAAKDPAERSEP